MKIGVDRMTDQNDRKPQMISYANLAQEIGQQNLGAYFSSLAVGNSHTEETRDLQLAAKRIYFGAIFRSTAREIEDIDSMLPMQTTSQSISPEDFKKIIVDYEHLVLSLLEKLTLFMQGKAYVDTVNNRFMPSDSIQTSLDTCPGPQGVIDFTVIQSAEADIDVGYVERAAVNVRDEVAEFLMETVQSSREAAIKPVNSNASEIYNEWLLETKNDLAELLKRLNSASRGFAKL